MESKKIQRVYKTIMLAILVAIVTFIGTTVAVYNKIGNGENIKYVLVGDKETEASDLLSRLKTAVDKYYLNSYDEKQMNNEAAKAYIKGLGDQYSEYITAEEYAEFASEVYGSFIGIGIYFGKTTDNQMLIVEPIGNSPAEKAGILAGDIITKVDNYVVTEESTNDDVANRIKGEEGTLVKIEILRGDKTYTFDIKRENIKLHYINSEVLENNIGYMEITSFDSGTADEFKTKLEDLKSKNIKSLIIDLRNNSGGIVDEATEIADYLLDKDKTIIITKDKDGKEEITKSEKDKLTDLPIVVITNANTASSSEILTVALKENKRAEIVGIKTYGKGVIQNVYRLSDGSALKLTTHEYYTPLGNKINGIGILPTHEIEVPNGVNVYSLPRDKDTQLDKAIELLK